MSETSVPRHGLHRRSLGKLGAAVTAGLAAPWISNSAKAAGQLNVVLNQGLLAKLWIDELHPEFEKRTGANVTVLQSVTGAMLAMLNSQKANPPDLMQFSEAGVFLARDEGLLRAHDPKKIPNFAFLRPEFNIADNYSAGCIDAMNTLHFNTRAMPAAPVAWAALWDKANRGQDRHPADRLEQRRAHGHHRGADRHRQAVQAGAVRP